MSDYISREEHDKIIRELNVECAYDMPSFWANKGKDYKVIPTKYHQGYQQALADVESKVSELPSADVREVVHCKDCRFYRQGTMNFPGRCNWHGGLDPDEDWFCADGERIEND